MTTNTVDVQEVPARLAELLALAQQGTDIIIADASRPIARLTGIAPKPSTRIAGLHRGAVWIRDDFDAPLPDEFWGET